MTEHCHYCGRPMVRRSSAEAKARPDLVSTRDHTKPKSHGGTTVVRACARCNGAKGDAPYALFVAFMEAAPFQSPDLLGYQFRKWVYALADDVVGQSKSTTLAILRLTEAITVPKGCPFTVSLSRRLDGSFDVIGGPTI